MNLPKGVIYVVLAGLAGLVAVFTIHRYVSVKTSVPVAATAPVAVAKVDVAPGTALGAGSVAVASWPAGLAPPKSASSLKQVDGRVVIVPITKGEPIVMSKLAPEGTAAGLGALLDEGKRALSVRVDDVAGVAGFIHPGDHVDVVVDLPLSEAKEHFSKTILQNVVVLTTGQIWEQTNDKKPVLVNAVTLQLSPDEAEILTLASNQGKIRLALRSRNNQAVVQTAGVATSTLIAGRPQKQREPARPQEKSVEVIKGLDRSKANL